MIDASKLFPVEPLPDGALPKYDLPSTPEGALPTYKDDPNKEPKLVAQRILLESLSKFERTNEELRFLARPKADDAPEGPKS
jgi:hypothetical protein